MNTDIVLNSEHITGTLHTGEKAEMKLTHLKRMDRYMWTQRALTHTASHLNRDYVCNESFDTISKTWLPCDWRRCQIVQTVIDVE